MLYFYYGTQYDKARGQARRVIEKYLEKNSLAPVIRFDSFSFNEQSFDEALGSQGLFGGHPILEIKDVLEVKEIKNFILDRLEMMSESEVGVVWTERKMDEKTLATISKFAKESKIFGNRKEEVARDSTAFNFAELCILKDKKKAWILFETNLRGQVAPEEIIGTMMWQYKVIVLAHKCSSAVSAGVSPYAFSKAKALSQKCTKDEALKSMMILTSLYHRAHRGELDLSVAIEKFVLDR